MTEETKDKALEAAVYLSISLPTLFRLTRAGELANLRVGRVIRYRLEDLEARIERLEEFWKRGQIDPASTILRTEIVQPTRAGEAVF